MPLKKLMVSSVMMTALALGTAGTAAAGDRVIKVRDACDPASFNAALGEGACERSGGGPRVTLDDAMAELIADHQVDKWSFDRERTTIDRGDTLRVRFDRGGEGHSFTEVERFGAGCVPDLNQLMGRTGPPAADCGLIESTYVGPMHTSMDVDGLTKGTHRFQCLIHPWMESTVVVR